MGRAIGRREGNVLVVLFTFIIVEAFASPYTLLGHETVFAVVGHCSDLDEVFAVNLFNLTAAIEGKSVLFSFDGFANQCSGQDTSFAGTLESYVNVALLQVLVDLDFATIETAAGLEVRLVLLFLVVDVRVAKGKLDDGSAAHDRGVHGSDVGGKETTFVELFCEVALGMVLEFHEVSKTLGHQVHVMDACSAAVLVVDVEPDSNLGRRGAFHGECRCRVPFSIKPFGVGDEGVPFGTDIFSVSGTNRGTN